jgi:hypothetical protein
MLDKMAEQLTMGASKDTIFERVRWLMSSGRTLDLTCKAIKQETGQKAGTTKTHFFRAKKVEALTLAASTQENESQPWLDRQEMILVAVLLGFLVENEGISAGALVQEGANMFGTKIIKRWLKTYMKQKRTNFTR